MKFSSKKRFFRCIIKYVKFFQNFMMKIVEDIWKNISSCFARVVDMLEWQVKS